MTEINMILAVSKDFGIGKNNSLPWNIPAELKLFKEKTTNCVLIVGSRTFKNMPILKNREVYRISRSTSTTEPHVFPTFESSFSAAEGTGKKVFVIGGKLIYEYVLLLYKSRIRLHISIIPSSYDCDTYLDPSLLSGFEAVKETIYEEFVHKEMIQNSLGENQYLDLLRYILDNGEYRNTRNGQVRSVFNYNMKFDLRKGYPLISTKKMFMKGIVEELLFFLRGDVNSKILEDRGVNIWKGNTSRDFLDSLGFTDREEGDMRYMYGSQWRHFNGEYDSKTKKMKGGKDQLQELVDKIKAEPCSRRHLLTSYNPLQAELGVLYCCHSVVLQFYVSGEFLDMFCYCRSVDTFLGLPFNIASSALLLEIIAKATYLTPRWLHFTLGDCHIYKSHEKAVRTQVSRLPYKFPKVNILKPITSVEDIENLKYKDFSLENYNSHERITAPMVV